MDVSGVILAGGKNVRMGVNKAFLEVNGQRMIDRTVSLFEKLFDEVIVVTNAPLAYSYLEVRIVADIVPESGALGGLYTGLLHSSCEHTFVAACDMPFLKREAIRYIVDQRNGFDVVLPHLEDGLHPLHAVYSKRCVKWIEELMEQRVFRIVGFFHKAKVREVRAEELLSFDEELRCITNINTPEDFEKVKRLT
jgi:molybdopterin-guanine dinucleotide biosynthesis protein A